MPVLSPDPFSDLALDDDPDVDGNVLTVTRTAGLISGMSWADSVTGKTIKTVAVTRTGSLSATVTTSVYLQDGVTIGSQKVETIARSGGKISTVTVTRPI